jgi:hypothetical protein
MAKVLRVIANPWSAIDEKARPCGAVLMDLDEHNPKPGKYVGAKLVASETAPRRSRKVGKVFEVTQEARFVRTWDFSPNPQDVPAPNGVLTGYYRDRVIRNELLAADEECAAAARIQFRSPVTIIAESKAARRAEFDLQHGAGAFDALQPEEPITETLRSEPIKAEPQRPAKLSKS